MLEKSAIGVDLRGGAESAGQFVAGYRRHHDWHREIVHRVDNRVHDDVAVGHEEHRRHGAWDVVEVNCCQNRESLPVTHRQ